MSVKKLNIILLWCGVNGNIFAKQSCSPCLCWNSWTKQPTLLNQPQVHMDSKFEAIQTSICLGVPTWCHGSQNGDLCCWCCLHECPSPYLSCTSLILHHAYHSINFFLGLKEVFSYTVVLPIRSLISFFTFVVLLISGCIRNYIPNN